MTKAAKSVSRQPRSRAPLRGTLALSAFAPGCALTAFASNLRLIHVLVSDEHSLAECPHADLHSEWRWSACRAV